MIYTALLKGDIRIVVDLLQHSFAFGSGRAGRFVDVVKRIVAVSGGKEFAILHDDIDSGAFCALIVFVVTDLNTARNRYLFTLFGVTRDGFAQSAPSGTFKKSPSGVRRLAKNRGVVPQ